jgi:hypothetical protein
MSEPDRGVSSLDTIDLATARILGEDLDAIVSYDDYLLKAADRCRAGHGVSPGLSAAKAASRLGAGLMNVGDRRAAARQSHPIALTCARQRHASSLLRDHG